MMRNPLPLARLIVATIVCTCTTSTVNGESVGCDVGTGVVSIIAGDDCFAFTPPPGAGPGNWEVAQGGTYTMLLAGVTECSGDTITVFVQSSSTGNFCFN